MSSLALPRADIRRSALFEFVALRGVDVLLVVAVMALATALLAFLPSSFGVDSWLALVTGREVALSGVPHHELLTSLSHGAAWVDQQWLSQLATYGLYLAGGLGLVGVAGVALYGAAVGGAVIGARKLGASSRAVLLALPLGLCLVAQSHEVRTQEFAMPLFVATAYLLASDARSSTRRVYWCLPILVVWGNLHGSVALGAMLVALRGATVAWEHGALLRHSPRSWVKPLVLIIGAPLCLLATPYGLGIISYYRTMLLGSSVMHGVTEWQPVTSAAIVAVPFFIAAGAAIWLYDRTGSRATLWEKLALLALAAGSIEVIRNVIWFGLLAVMVVPRVIDPPASWARGRGRERVNGALALAAAAALAIAITGTLARPASAIEFHYQRAGLLTAVERVTQADRSLKVLTDVRVADWLLWRDPALAGRVANDARFELLTPAQMARLQNVFGVVGVDWQQGAAGYRLVVLDRVAAPDAVKAFAAEAGSRTLYDDGQRVVILRSARERG